MVQKNNIKTIIIELIPRVEDNLVHKVIHHTQHLLSHPLGSVELPHNAGGFFSPACVHLPEDGAAGDGQLFIISPFIH